jgi:hypothetical protein
MRLTLRTLLAYLDDTLEPAKTKQIGAKIAENEAAQKLIARIKQVTRRRRLTTPEAAGSGAKVFDPNKVADYLDGRLSSEEAAEIEKLCLESDVHLAEVAACHQILTLSQGEVAGVPPTAYQRMYGLVHGQEALPYRRAPVPPHHRAEDAARLDEAEETDDPLLLGLPAFRREDAGLRRFVPAAAVLLLIGVLGTVLYLATAGRERNPDFAGASSPSSPDRDVTDKVPPKQEPLVPRPNRAVASWLGESEFVNQPGASVWTMCTSWAAARTAMPNVLLVADTLAETGTAGSDPVQPPNQSPKLPSTARVDFGTHTSLATRDSMLFRQVADQDWRLVRPEAKVRTNEPLLTLPGFRSELTLDNRMTLELVGSLPEIARNRVLEAALRVQPNEEADVDLVLDRGRVVITNKPAAPSLVRVRFFDQVWDIRLLQPTSQIGLELSSGIAPGAQPWMPLGKLSLITAGGDIELSRGGAAKPETIPAGKLLIWDQQIEAKYTAVPFPMPDSPQWMRKAPVADEVRTATSQLQQRIVDKLKEVGEGQEMEWIKIALEEALASPTALERRLALYTFGALDQIRYVVAALEDADRAQVRETALQTLGHWLGRRADQHLALRAVLVQEEFQYPDEDADITLLLLKGFDEPNRQLFEVLLRLLQHRRLAIRELAYVNLRELAPARMPPFDPAGMPEQRNRAVETMRRALLK